MERLPIRIGHSQAEGPAVRRVVNLHQDAVAARLERDANDVFVYRQPATRRIEVHTFAVEPARDAIVAADFEEGLLSGIRMHLGVCVCDAPHAAAKEWD